MLLAESLGGVAFVTVHTVLCVAVLYLPWNRGDRESFRVTCLRALSTCAVIALSLVNLQLFFTGLTWRELSRTYHWLRPWHSWQVYLLDSGGFLVLLFLHEYRKRQQTPVKSSSSSTCASTSQSACPNAENGIYRNERRNTWCMFRSLLIAPITEELLFRCVFDAAMRSAQVPELASMIFNGVMFAVAHAHHYFRHQSRSLLGKQLLVTFCFGCVQVVCLRRTDYSLWACIATHALANALDLQKVFSDRGASHFLYGDVGHQLGALLQAAAPLVFILRYALDMAMQASPFRSSILQVHADPGLLEERREIMRPTTPFSLFLIEYHQRDPIFGRFMALCSMLPQLLFAAEVTAVYCWRSPRALLLAVGQIVNETLSYALKRSCRIPRPPIARLEADAFGWPSSHAQFMSYLYVFYVLYVSRPQRKASSSHNGEMMHQTLPKRRKTTDSISETVAVMFLLGLSSVLVAASRVYLAYHYPSQVWYGIIMGTIFAITWFLASENVFLSYVRSLRILVWLGFGEDDSDLFRSILRDVH
jgi:dolichyldiphosphatase